MSRYGMPYMGSKNKIVDRLIEVLPPAENFYDLFMGGGAVTHRALLTTGKWKNFICNDLNQLVVKAWNMAIKGEFKNEKRWISREDFKRLKDTDPYVAICWSFGNNLKGYLYNPDIEPWKFALHRARVFGDFQPLREMGILTDASRSDIQKNHKEYLAKYVAWVKKEITTDDKHFGELENLEILERLQSLESLQRLERLQSLESLQRLESLQSLQSLNDDYRNITIKPNSTIYCDIPYKDTAEYTTGAFDFDAFYNWAEQQTEPVFISSYNLPADKFDCIAEWDVTCQLSATNNSQQVTERLFVPKNQQERGNVGLFGGLYAD